MNEDKLNQAREQRAKEANDLVDKRSKHMSEDSFDLEGVKSFRQALEILFDGSGTIDTDEILMKYDDLIEQVEQLEKERDELKDCIEAQRVGYLDSVKKLEAANQELREKVDCDHRWSAVDSSGEANPCSPFIKKCILCGASE